ncbi:MAG: NAD(P)/FAD-dependent oxidoreductase [Chloroflexota bacterium]
MLREQKRIAIIGGGIMGVSIAHHLSKQISNDITIFERSDSLGGLASAFDYNGTQIDRYYHTVLSSDLSMHNLMKVAGVHEQLHFVETKQGFYDNGEIHPFNTPIDLMSYKPLNLIERFRLGLQVVYAQFQKDWEEIDKIPVRDWLIKISGERVYEKVWKPLLRAKFDTTYNNVPATYIWSRLIRMTSTRQGVTSKEMMCYLEDGYPTLIDALGDKLREAGVTINLSTAIDSIDVQNGQAQGISTSDGGYHPFDIVISTLPSPILANLLPDDADTAFSDKLNSQEYLGVMCPILILKEKLSPYYVLNITDERIPFTAVVETTNLIAPEHVGGNHLVYLPKYLAPNSEILQWSDEKIKSTWMKHFMSMFPDFDQSLIKDFIVQRARYVEPIRPLGTLDQIPSIATPISNLYMGNTAMFYPDLSNGEAVTKFATKLAQQIIAEMPTLPARQATERDETIDAYPETLDKTVVAQVLDLEDTVEIRPDKFRSLEYFPRNV